MAVRSFGVVVIIMVIVRAGVHMVCLSQVMRRTSSYFLNFATSSATSAVS